MFVLFIYFILYTIYIGGCLQRILVYLSGRLHRKVHLIDSRLYCMGLFVVINALMINFV